MILNPVKRLKLILTERGLERKLLLEICTSNNIATLSSEVRDHWCIKSEPEYHGMATYCVDNAASKKLEQIRTALRTIALRKKI